MRKLLYRGLRKIGVLKRLNLKRKTILNGKKYVIPIFNEIGFDIYLKLSEPWMQFVIDRFVSKAKADTTFIDIGMNLGQTLLKVKCANETIKYIGFEPNPICVNYVSTLIKENNFLNTEIFPVGIGKETSILKLNLFYHEEVDSAASIIENFRKNSKVVKNINVPIFNFAEVPLEANLQVGFIKIDVEGAELEVLSSLTPTIEKDRPIILIEILPAYDKENLDRISRQDKIQEILRRLCYSIYRIIKSNDQFTELQEISDIGIHSDLNMCDYLLVPSENAEEVKSLL